MIKLNGQKVDIGHFPDGTLLLKECVSDYSKKAVVMWLFENNEELVALYFLTKHIRSNGINDIELCMPYIPNARQDRVKNPEDVFTLRYFAEMINSLNFSKVTVLDPHSYVSEALINNIRVQSPKKYAEYVIEKLEKEYGDEILMFYPDEGAVKRYSSMFERPFAFGMKKRDWVTGKIEGLDVSGEKDKVKGSKILIVDDICSRGGTFYYSAKALKELGAKKVFLYVSHCENTILDGEILKSDLIEKVYTTNSIFTKSHDKIEVLDYEQN